MKYYTFILCFYNLLAYAVTPSEEQAIATHLLAPHSSKATTLVGIGDVANNLSDFVQGLIQMAKTLSIFGGVTLLIFSIQLYIKHRNNPMETPLSMVALMFFISLGLIILPLIPIKF